MTCMDSWDSVPKPVKIVLYTILGVIAGFGLGLLFGWIIVWLWNWLMPMIFGLPVITFWQGVGLFILSKILFSGFSSHSDSYKKEQTCKDWKCADGTKRKYESWKHYDEWWQREGKAAFETFTDKAESESAPDAPQHEDA
ncbi:MAG: ABC transporter permease [Clostridiales bacterium]|nr:ABC transporter permease [Clostridiales bacterium]